MRLNASTQNNVVTYPVWIKVMNEDLRLRPALTATVKIRTSSAPGVVRIPNAALRFRPTSDMYTALGLEPPAAPTRGQGAGGRGRGDAQAAPGGSQPDTPAARQGGQQGGGRQSPDGAARPQGQRQAQNRPAGGANGDAAAQTGEGQRGQRGQRGTDGRGGEGFGRGQFANLTPEERQRMMEQFGGRGGRGGGRGGAGRARRTSGQREC